VRAPRRVWLKACFSQPGLLRRQVSSEQASSHPILTGKGTCGTSGKVDLKACEDEAGNAANVPLLHELQHGAPRRKQVRILSTDAGDKRTLEKQVLLVAQGARGTLYAQALRGGDVIVCAGYIGELVPAQPKLHNLQHP